MNRRASALLTGLASIGEGFCALFGARPLRRRSRSGSWGEPSRDPGEFAEVGLDLRAAFDEVRATMTEEQRRAVGEMERS